MATDPRRRPTSAAPPPPAPPTPPPAVPDSTSIPLDTTTTPPPTTSANLPAKPGHPSSPDFTLRFCTVCASNNNRSMEAHLRLTTPQPTSTSTEQQPQRPVYPTLSFGTGSLVRLPGPNITSPNVYTFNNTSYARIHAELLAKDERLYRSNGLLPMLERNKSVKWGPERWQDWAIGVPRTGNRLVPPAAAAGDGSEDAERELQEAQYLQDRGHAGTEAGVVDVVITCEERCWDAVLEDLLARGSPLNRPVHVFNVDIKDNHEEALVGGRAILELADALNEAAMEERGKNGGQEAAFERGAAGARRGFDERVPEILAEWQERWPGLPALWSLAWF